MRDSRIDFGPIKGLAASPGMLNVPLCEDISGMVAVKEGMSVFLPPSSTSSFTFTASHPFPQYIDCHDGKHVLLRNSIARLRSLTGLAIRMKDIPNDGYPWSFAEIGDFTILSNFRIVLQILKGALTYNEEIPVFRSCAAFGGQFLLGNVWAWGELRSNLIIWPAPGTVNFEPSSSSAGGIVADGIGDVLALKLLRRTNYTTEGMQYVMVYGSEGVGLLTPRDYPASYGFKRFDDIPGIANSLAVTGTDTFHVFVGSDRRLWMVSLDKIECIDYNDYLCLGSEFVLSYNSTEGRVYVSF
jgi:hypothetical protein